MAGFIGKQFLLKPAARGTGLAALILVLDRIQRTAAEEHLELHFGLGLRVAKFARWVFGFPEPPKFACRPTQAAVNLIYVGKITSHASVHERAHFRRHVVLERLNAHAPP